VAGAAVCIFNDLVFYGMPNGALTLFDSASRDPLEPTSRIVRREPLPLGAGQKEAPGPSPAVALLLAILVGLIVFTIIWRIRKTFGMKE
jgi:hypothetical protein